MDDGTYPDPAMRMVFFVSADTSEAAIEANEATAEALLAADCPVVNAGETLGPFDPAGGSCYELTVGTEPDSFFPMDTTDVTGIVIFAQHVPIEFERDPHYLKDSAGVDIEPIAEEGADGHAHDHDHGHGHGDEEARSCACEAITMGFKIDCNDSKAMLDALSVTKTNGCSADCTSDLCRKNFLILQVQYRVYIR